MLNRVKKYIKISLLGALFLTLSPVVSHAQYYYSNTILYVTTQNAANVTSSGVTLNGVVNGVTQYNNLNLKTWFEYGINPNFGYTTLQNSGYIGFSANVANLSPDTTYYFRAVAQTTQGMFYGNVNSFRTLRTNFAAFTDAYYNGYDTYNYDNSPVNPSVITNLATGIGTRSARLNSLIINSQSDPATTWFEWGIMPTLGDITPMISLGTLASAKHVNTITGLKPNTTYFFRAVVQNSATRIAGATLSFTTERVAIAPAVVEKEEPVTNTSTLEPAPLDLGANAIGSDSFFPVSLLGWLLLIILILILIILSKHAHSKFSTVQIEEAHAPVEHH